MRSKIFQSRDGQAVLIPDELKIDATEVEIFRRGDEIVLKPRPKNLGAAFKLLGEMPSDFMEKGRAPGAHLRRGWFDGYDAKNDAEPDDGVDW
ncbi:MAG: hypothetical protein R3341_07250 [Methylophaga sp.]|nr:hypothetical protein [Methylophaga sp.]